MTALRPVLLALALLPTAAAAQDNVWDARVRASAEAAQSYQGQLDGAWTLTDAAGRPLYDFELVEPAAADATLQGVFRDVRAAAVPGDIGFVDSLAHTGGLLTLAFHPTDGAAPVTISLKSQNGAWTGDLREGDAVTPVKLLRGPDF